jgi:hypothetical protein
MKTGVAATYRTGNLRSLFPVIFPGFLKFPSVFSEMCPGHLLINDLFDAVPQSVIPHFAEEIKIC